MARVDADRVDALRLLLGTPTLYSDPARLEAASALDPSSLAIGFLEDARAGTMHVSMQLNLRWLLDRSVRAGVAKDPLVHGVEWKLVSYDSCSGCGMSHTATYERKFLDFVTVEGTSGG